MWFASIMTTIIRCYGGVYWALVAQREREYEMESGLTHLLTAGE
jgi:hypothetical protein